MGDLSGSGGIGPPHGNFDPPGDGPFGEQEVEPKHFVPGNLLVFLQQRDSEMELLDDDTIIEIIRGVFLGEYDDVDIRDMQVISLTNVKITVIQTSVMEEEPLVDLSLDLCEQLANLDDFEQYIINCSVDTLMSGAPGETPPPDQAGGGGPGSKPVEPADVDNIPRSDCSGLLTTADAPWDFSLDDGQGPDYDRLKDAHDNRDTKGKDVIVFILDTLPPQTEDEQVASVSRLRRNFRCPPGSSGPVGLLTQMCRSMSDAAITWQSTNPLVDCLFNQGNLTPHYNPIFNGIDADGNPLCDPSVSHVKHNRKVGDDEYPYFAMDHGTYIAGIIHTLAPHAEIHIVETLNAFAHGSLSTFVYALKEVLDTLTGPEATNVVINASLIFDRSLDSSVLQIAVDDFINGIDDLGHKLLMFAAAGNDDGAPTRLPAALAEFHAVAALNKSTDTRSAYSNQGEFAAWGGQINSVVLDGKSVNVTDNANGILGLYIGEYPNIDEHPSRAPMWLAVHIASEKAAGRPAPENSRGFTNVLNNNSGWARWAGTSFATAILVGCAAQLINHGVAFADVIPTLEKAFVDAPTGEHRILMCQPDFP